MAGSAAAAPPVNTISPEVTGYPQVGQPLVCHSGSWTGNASFSYIWLREGQEVGTGYEHFVTDADRGYYISCITIATNSEGSEEEESSNSFLIPGEHGSPPHNEVPPEIAPASGSVGTKLTCSQGTWSGNPAPTFAYQWFRDETAIADATSSYTLEEADAGHELSCKVTGTNSAGFETVASKNSVVVAGTKLENTKKPKVLGSEKPGVGESLTCSPGEWRGSPSPTFKYQWFHEGVAIPSATASIYTVAAEYETQYLTCKVTAENGQGSPVTVESENRVKVPGVKPRNTEAPHIAGTVAAGDTVACEKGSWTGSPAPTYSYQWLKEDIALPGETRTTYLIPSADRGLKISCEVTGTNPEGTETVSSAEVTVPQNGGSGKPVDKTLPEVVGTLTAGQTAKCNPGTWTGEPEFAYQWRVNKANIAGATSSTFQIETAEEGGELSCQVTASNSEGSALAESAQRHVAGHAPELLAMPEVRGEPVVGETLTCTSGAWEGSPAPTFTYQWLEGGKTVGSTESYVVLEEDRGQSLTCKVTATNGEPPPGEASAKIEIPGKVPRPPKAPEITWTGELKAGEALTCEAGTWTGEPTPVLTYQWLLEGVPISSATQSAYEITPTNAGRSISCEVTGTNSAGSDSVYSKAVRVLTGRPKVEPGTAVEVLGAPVVGETLTCSRGTWEAKPAPAFSYQWLRDGAVVASGEGYKVELADQGHSFSCVVTATNPEGSTPAASANSVTIPAAVVKPKTPETGPTGPTQDGPTAAAILTSVGAQLTSAQRGAKIGSLLKDSATWFRFTALASGTLELSWYEVPKGAHVSSVKSKPQPVLVATTTASFKGATLKTVELHLTRAGRALLRKSKRITLTAKAVFALPHGISVTWIKTFVLTR